MNMNTQNRRRFVATLVIGLLVILGGVLTFAWMQTKRVEPQGRVGSSGAQTGWKRYTSDKYLEYVKRIETERQRRFNEPGFEIYTHRAKFAFTFEYPATWQGGAFEVEHASNEVLVYDPARFSRERWFAAPSARNAAYALREPIFLSGTKTEVEFDQLVRRFSKDITFLDSGEEKSRFVSIERLSNPDIYGYKTKYRDQDGYITVVVRLLKDGQVIEWPYAYLVEQDEEAFSHIFATLRFTR